jgi:hypothetical protein
MTKSGLRNASFLQLKKKIVIDDSILLQAAGASMAKGRPKSIILETTDSEEDEQPHQTFYEP